MTRIMRDSTTLADIPTHGLDIIAAYINGRYATTPAQVRAHAPNALIAWIDVNGSHPEADILDVETGDATVPVAVLWAKTHHHVNPGTYPPIIYCNRSTLTPLFNAMNFAGLHIGADFRLWPATLDGTTHLADMTGVTAVQSRGEQQTGGHYDESDVYDPTWLTTPAAGPFLHHTAAGDTWAGIAAAQGVTVGALARMSATLTLPAGGPAPAPKP